MKNVNSDLAYDYIRKRILSGEYPPGRALMTNVLSEEIGVSRTPVRDALRQLEVDGLVSIRARLGASVKAMDFNEFREMCGLRLALEAYAAGLAAQHRTDADLQEMVYALEAMRLITAQALDPLEEVRTLPQLIKEDVRFHIAIMTAAKNELMKKQILRLHLINRVVSGPAPNEKEGMPSPAKASRDALRERVLASHEEIYKAIEKKDIAGAKQAMELHIQDIIDRGLRQMARTENVHVGRELTAEEMVYSAL